MSKAITLVLFRGCLVLLLSVTGGASVVASERLSVRYFNDLEALSNDEPFWLNLATRSTDRSGSFSRTDATHPYGIGWRSSLPGGDGSHTMVVNVGFKARTDVESPSAQLVFILQKNGEQIYWNSISFGDRLDPESDWRIIEGMEQVVPAAFTSQDYSFTCYVWNNGQIGHVDIDDFELSITNRKSPGFLPVKPEEVDVDKGEYQTIAAAGVFRLQYDKINGRVKITDQFSNALWRDFRLFNDGVSPESDWPLWDAFLRYDGNKDGEDERAFVFSFRRIASATVTFVLYNHGQRLDVKYRCEFPSATDLKRQSLTFRHEPVLERVMVPDQAIEQLPVFDEYWLGKTGAVTWTSGKDAWTIYRPTGISSLQLDVPGKNCWINADAAFDHPLLHWPLGKESKNIFEDASFSRYKAGDTLCAEFSILHHPSGVVLPRISIPPKGKAATFIFTEHADYTSMRSQKAVEFGSDTSTADYAQRGLFGRNIPTTKSVFYWNPEKVSNADRTGFEKGMICTVSESSGFSDFLRKVSRHGTEVAIHTPEHHTSTRASVKSATERLNADFQARVWIDHGYDNGKKSNREDLVCDGFRQGSPYYIGDILTENGIDYLWNGFYEDSSLFNPYRFNSELVVPHPAFGPSLPRPAYWTHPGRTGKLVHFPTTATLDPPDGGMWDYYLGDARLDFLAKSRGTFIGHYYPARLDSTNGFYDWKGEVWTINPEFDKALERIVKRRDKGVLWVTTISNYLDRAIDIDSIHSWIDETGVFHIRNGNPKAVEGMSLEIPDRFDVVTEKPFRERVSGASRFIWFNLIPDEEVRLSFKEKKNEGE